MNFRNVQYKACTVSEVLHYWGTIDYIGANRNLCTYYILKVLLESEYKSGQLNRPVYITVHCMSIAICKPIASLSLMMW